MRRRSRGLAQQLVLACLITVPAWAMANEQWSEREKRILQSLSLHQLSAKPASPSNQYADLPAAVSFGKALFFDATLSAAGDTACATCHVPELHFTDGKPTATNNGRNTPSVVGSAWSHWFYWDGRRDSLWSQALVPFEASDEMGSNRVHVLWHIAQSPTLAKQYQRLFGALPALLNTTDKPKAAAPIGDAVTQDNWYRLSPQARAQINSAFANIGKALAAYERTLEWPLTKFDRYVANISEHTAQLDPNDDFSAQEIAGAKLFIDQSKTQCLQCHNGPLLSNGNFHNIGTGRFTGAALDFGRLFGIESVLQDPFNCQGQFSDAPQHNCPQLRFLKRTEHHGTLAGAYKTPTLRHLSQTGPYFHDGRFATLGDVLQHYVRAHDTNNGAHELQPLTLTQAQQAELIAFLQTLSTD